MPSDVHGYNLNRSTDADSFWMLTLAMLSRWRTAKVKTWSALLAASVIWISACPGAVAQSAPSGDRSTLMQDLLNLVEQDGWRVDLSRMCAAMKLSAEADCKFKQIAVSPSVPGAASESHGFNVPLSPPGGVTFVVIFHNGPLVGNFFVVSPQGDLRAAFYRAKGIDYTEIPLPDASAAFNVSLRFWQDNLQTLRELGSKEKPPNR